MKKDNFYKRAVLTIEAALTVPMFLMAMVTLLSFANMYYVKERIDSAVYEEARKIAILSCDGNTYGIGGVEASIEERLGYEFLNSGVIKGNSAGLDYSDTDLTDTEIITISVRYAFNIPFGLAAFNEIELESRALAHTWTGYINGAGACSELSEYVYMAKNGEVYHRTRECSHIRLHIQSVSGKDIKNLRNEKRSKYKKCDYCRPKLTDARLYITDDGDKYHNTLTCMGLKRTVIRVRLSDIEGVAPCSRCGY